MAKYLLFRGNLYFVSYLYMPHANTPEICPFNLSLAAHCKYTHTHTHTHTHTDTHTHTYTYTYTHYKLGAVGCHVRCSGSKAPKLPRVYIANKTHDNIM